MKILGYFVILIVGAILLIGGAWFNIKLHWIDHPEATNRMLWIEHTWVMVLSPLAMLTGFILCAFGFILINEKNRGR